VGGGGSGLRNPESEIRNPKQGVPLQKEGVPPVGVQDPDAVVVTP